MYLVKDSEGHTLTLHRTRRRGNHLNLSTAITGTNQVNTRLDTVLSNALVSEENGEHIARVVALLLGNGRNLNQGISHWPPYR